MITQQPFYTPLTPTRHAKLTWIKQTENQSEKNVMLWLGVNGALILMRQLHLFTPLWFTTAMGQLDF